MATFLSKHGAEWNYTQDPSLGTDIFALTKQNRLSLIPTKAAQYY